MLGIDPSPYTLREMVWMLKGKRIHDWGQTGSIVAIIANANRNPKRRRAPYQIADFVPTDLRRYFRQPRGLRMTRGTLHAMKGMFKSGRKETPGGKRR